MKRFLILLTITILIIFLVLNKEDYYIIPKEAIRFRIIANSNSTKDQFIKIKVKQKLQDKFKDDFKDVSNINDSRTIINNNIDNYSNIVGDTLKEYNYDKDFSINYGMNYFPEKVYKGVKYEEGEYESLVVKLGKAEGENWWCVLFPPICEYEETDKDKIEYKFFIKEIINKYF